MRGMESLEQALFLIGQAIGSAVGQPRYSVASLEKAIERLKDYTQDVDARVSRLREAGDTEHDPVALLRWLLSGPEGRTISTEEANAVVAAGLATRAGCSDGNYLEPTPAGELAVRGSNP